MALIKNSALSLISAILDLPTSQLASLVNLDDGDVSLTLPIFPELARRGLAGIRSGWYQMVLENVHSGADDEGITIEPYTPGVTAVAPYPAIVPLDFDVWLLRIGMVQTTGAANLTEGWVRILLPAESLGAGIEDTGGPVITQSNYTLARFTDIIVAPGTPDDMAVDANGEPVIYTNLRLPRGARINFSTRSAAAATYRALLTIGLFPSSLGQDVAT